VCIEEANYVFVHEGRIVLILAMDVSADLEEMGRTPIALVCSGVKAILDLARTMEYLETKGVTVTTLGHEGVEVPAFYSRESGIIVRLFETLLTQSPLNSSSIEEAAKLIRICKFLPLWLIQRCQSFTRTGIWNCDI
jgi:pseudouridine-5'-phosphate glycosidase